MSRRGRNWRPQKSQKIRIGFRFPRQFALYSESDAHIRCVARIQPPGLPLNFAFIKTQDIGRLENEISAVT